MNRGGPLDVAIVGMGCRFPDAPDLSAYAENILAGRAGADGPAPAGTAPSTLGRDVAEAALADAGLGTMERERERNRLFVGHADARHSWLDALDSAARALNTRDADLAVVVDATAEGASAVILKRRADAERDGDRIYAVLQELSVAEPSMNGHPTPGGGVAGLIAAALSLYHRVLHAGRPWIQADPAVPRRLSVDGPALLEDHAASADADADAGSGQPGALLHWETEAILLSAPDRAGLAERARERVVWLGNHPDASLKDIAFTLNGSDELAAGSARLGLVVSSPADLASRLSALASRLDDPSCRPIGDGRGTYFWDEPLGESGGLAFLFPGEGSQYPGMLADLCVHFPEVRRQFDTSDRIALELGDAVPPSEYLFGRNESPDGDVGLWSAPTAVNVVLNAQWALYQVLTRLGLRPDAIAGHSSGELLAMAAAGVFDADQHLEQQLAALGAFFRGLESSGDVPSARLVAVAAARDRVEAACQAVDAAEVAIAIDNCPHQVVLAGPPAEVERVVRHLREANILMEDLPFHRAYHTPAFAPVIGPVAAFFGRLSFRVPRVPLYSCATRDRMPPDPEAIRELAVAQWTRTVAFRETVETMHADGVRIFVDVGARGNLAGFVQDILRGRPGFAIAANLPRRSGPTQLNHLVAALFAQGVPIRPGFLYARRRPKRVDAFVGRSVSTEASHRTRFHGFGDDRNPANRCLPVTGASIETSLHPVLAPDAPPVPSVSRFDWSEIETESGVNADTDATMLAFQETMRAFLETQQAVIGAYLGVSPADLCRVGETHRMPGFASVGFTHPATAVSGPEPGPWIDEVRRLVPGSEIEAVFILDARRDPIAEHHTLGSRRVSALDPARKGLPVLPFAVMAEMAAQAAALLVSPGLVLVKLAQLHAHKWVRYEDEPVVLAMRGRRELSRDDGEERVWVGLFNRGPGGRLDAPRPVFEAVAVFTGSTPTPPEAGPWALDHPRPSRFTAESLYGEQWLFHGPAFQALVEVGESSGRGIDGFLRVLPWEPLLAPGRPANLHTDLIALDSFTHLLGCWGLDELADHGDVVFPLGMEELQLFGERPAVGTDVACRISVEQLQRHRVRASAELVRPDGTVWMRLRDWEDWRFHWPSRYRDVFRQPQETFIGEELPLETFARSWEGEPPGEPMSIRAVPEGTVLGGRGSVRASLTGLRGSDGASPSPFWDRLLDSLKVVWLAPPADMGRPVWRDVLEQAQLDPTERAEHLAQGGSEAVRSQRLWGRIAAKEAARRIWRADGRGPTYPADLAVMIEENGRPRLTRVDDPADRSLPSVAIATAEGVAIAVAARDPRARLGIAVAMIGASADGDGPSAFTPDERAMLARWIGPAHREWQARFRCAREAAVRAAGPVPVPAGGMPFAEVVGVDGTTGAVQVGLAATPARSSWITTTRRGEYAWAWTIVEGVGS